MIYRNEKKSLSSKTIIQKTALETVKDYNLYVTLEPCSMCASAIQNSRIKRLYFGCNDEKSGAVNSGAKIFNQKNCNHKPEIYDGIRASDCSVLIKNFFNEIRKKI